MNDELIVHAAFGFTKTLCGISFNDTVPCQMTNVSKNVTCPDCITILEIWNKNKIRSDKDESDLLERSS